MCFTWLVILIIYGLAAGFASIDPLMWGLLVPMCSQDWWDLSHKNRRN